MSENDLDKSNELQIGGIEIYPGGKHVALLLYRDP